MLMAYWDHRDRALNLHFFNMNLVSIWTIAFKFVQGSGLLKLGRTVHCLLSVLYCLSRPNYYQICCLAMREYIYTIYIGKQLQGVSKKKVKVVSWNIAWISFYWISVKSSLSWLLKIVQDCSNWIKSALDFSDTSINVRNFLIL